MNDDDDDDQVGYGRPPKKHQFKKGQSGCPSGGHAQRKAKAKARAEAEKAREKQKEKDLVGIFHKVAKEDIMAIIGGVRRPISRVEATVRKALDRPLQPDAGPRDIASVMKLYEKAGYFKQPPEKARSSVLVVYPVMGEEEWAEATEGELLPKNPLEGIPGAEGLLDAPPRRGVPPDDDDKAT